MTLGEYRVGMYFNPGGNPLVDLIKRKVADLIDLCESMRDSSTDGEKARLIFLAQTHLENAAMWGVQAAMKARRPE